MQEVEGKLLVVADIELLDVHLGEDVERRLGLDRSDAVDRVEGLVHVVALLTHATARRHIALHGLMPTERRLDDGLRRHVRAQAHVGEHVHAEHEVLAQTLVA